MKKWNAIPIIACFLLLIICVFGFIEKISQHKPAETKQECSNKGVFLADGADHEVHQNWNAGKDEDSLERGRSLLSYESRECHAFDCPYCKADNMLPLLDYSFYKCVKCGRGFILRYWGGYIDHLQWETEKINDGL